MMCKKKADLTVNRERIFVFHVFKDRGPVYSNVNSGTVIVLFCANTDFNI